MLQVASFALPAEQDRANEFLKTHKPVGNINFNKDTIVVFYDEDPAAELVELLESVGRARVQQQIALHMIKRDMAGLNPAHNKGKYEELESARLNTQEALDDQDAKAELVTKWIEEKRTAA